MGRNNNNNNNNGYNNNNNLGVDYSQGGAITVIPNNSLNTMLYNAQNQRYQQPGQLPVVYDQPQPLTVEQAYAQPTEVRYVNARTISKPSVPDIEIPYTEVWKASRLHPQNPGRYFWHPYYTIVEYAKSPVGVFLIVVSILLGGLNFLLNGSYQGPGYAAGKAIPVVPREMPKFATPVVDVIE